MPSFLGRWIVLVLSTNTKRGIKTSRLRNLRGKLIPSATTEGRDPLLAMVLAEDVFALLMSLNADATALFALIEKRPIYFLCR